MKISLSELKKVPGFVGAYIFHSGKGIVAKDLPGDYLKSDLTDLAQTVQQICHLSIPVFGGVKGVTYCYREFFLVVRELTSQVFLFVLVMADADLQKLAEPLDHLYDDLRGRLMKKG